MRIAYFAHDLADAAVQKRVRMLRSGGARRVTLLGFERSTMPAPLIGTPTFALGRTAGGKLAERILTIFTALPEALRRRKYWANADTIIARNLEMLLIVRLLAPIVGARGRIVYECLDIHRLMLREDRIGKAMRWLERFCMKRVSALLTSSPAFVTQYFHPVQDYQGEILLVENKVLALDAPAPTKAAPPVGPPYRIVWAGALRCAKSFEILSGLADAGGVEVHLWGAPALDQLLDFHERIAANPHMTFHGRYAASDLHRIYGDAHFFWAVDYFEAGGNSEWLLPNRLYEGLFHGVVPIARANTETAHWLEINGVGVALAEPLARSLPDFLADAASRFPDLRRAAVNLDPNLVAFDLEECRALVTMAVEEAAPEPQVSAYA